MGAIMGYNGLLWAIMGNGLERKRQNWRHRNKEVRRDRKRGITSHRVRGSAEVGASTGN